MLQSLRTGFATNSSSAHSVILHSDPRFMQMIQGDSFDSILSEEGAYFSFTTPKDKLAYLLWLHDREGATISAHELVAFISKIFNNDSKALQALREKVKDFVEPDDYSSDLLCPANIDRALWFQFVMNGPISIHSYSDSNTPYENAIAGDPNHGEIYAFTYRQDKNAIIAYSKNSGFKMRWSPDPYTKSTIPELVDMKITDYCGWGCKFCYQGSTTEGKHAEWDVLEASMRAFAQDGVFEVAIGGGEPVEHPRFADLIKLACDLNITLNFTTYGVDWATHKHPVVRAMRAKKWRGGIGVSVHSAKDAQKVADLSHRLRQHLGRTVQVMAQTVVGATPAKATQTIVETCIENDHPVLLLGYKTTGRGGSFTKRVVDGKAIATLLGTAANALKTPLSVGQYGEIIYRKFTLSVDTAFVDSYGPELDAAGVPMVLRTSPEGKFSMYVDAVANTAAPSSYCAPEQSVPWDPQALERIFARF